MVADKAPEKYVSAMRPGSASRTWPRPRIAEAMVDERVGVPGLVEPGRLLTLSTQEAIRVGYAKGEIADEPALLAAIGFPGAQIVTAEVNWAEQVVRFLTNPLVQPLLLSLGLLGLVFEIKAGAFGLGGVVSLAALGLFFGSNLVLGLAGWEEVILLGAGLIALGIEVFVLPGFGVAGIVGLLAIGTAIVLAMLGGGPTPADVTQALFVLGECRADRGRDLRVVPPPADEHALQRPSPAPER
jgi:membrane-bound serine protease (ClpP class)